MACYNVTSKNKCLKMVMKKLFKTRINSTSVNLGLLLLRLSAGGFMLTHGYPKLQRLLSGELRFGDPLGLG
ncbi:MAG: hypothetical protein OQK57_02445, partial [Ignavibacteriaceae bacterium]|nr:hypothetical protein [Ignavibacteriaceae bacterium]